VSGLSIRVACALLLVSWLRMSDGNAFWAGVLPAAITCSLVLIVARAWSARRR